MTTAEFKKIARLLKEAYKELEEEALKSGVSLLSKDYDEMQTRVREAVLESQGFTLEEYRSAKAKVAGFSQADLVDETEKIDDKVSKKVSESIISLEERIEQLERAYVPTAEDIEDISNRVAKKYIKPPQITNQIIERIKEPKIIKETVKVKEEYNDKPLRKELESISSKVKDLPDLKTLHEEFIKPVQNLKESIEIEWGSVMPDFRKMGMGLDSRISALEAGGGGGGGTWGSITGTLSNQTDLQTALDAKQNTITGLTASGAELNILDGATLTTTELNYVDGVTSAIQTQIDGKADKSGALTQFVGNTAWRVFYSDGSGDITELALGADGTFLKSNGASAAPSFATPAGSGDVSKVGTPVNNQIGVWTGDGTIEGDASLTWDGTSFNIATAKNFQIAGATILADAAGTTTLSNIDAIDATTEATIETAIDTLSNLTSIQGRTVTLADAGANAIFGWDDTAGAYENLTQAEARTILGLGTAAYVATDLSDLNEATIETAIDTLANLTSVQGRTVTLADAGFDVLLGWDDSAGAYKNFALADLTAEASPATGDYVLIYGAEGDLRKVDWGDLPAGGGGVDVSGTPTDNQLAVWTDADTIEGSTEIRAGASAAWNVTTPGTSQGSLHLVPGSTDHFGGALTFGASDSGSGLTAQAGIYTRTDGAYGTRMYFATTGNFTNGSTTAFWINEAGEIILGAGSVDYGSYKLQVNGLTYFNGNATYAATSNATLSTFTGTGTNNSVGVAVPSYTNDDYIPGIAFYDVAGGFDSGVPKGIVLTRFTNSGSFLYLGTSSDYGTGANRLIQMDYNGNWSPNTTNVGALGTASLQWADLFLAEGGVINWDNGDATLTQTGNSLVLAGADLAVPTKTPSSASDTGVAGTIAWDASYIYVCTATNTWKRVAIATW